MEGADRVRIVSAWFFWLYFPFGIRDAVYRAALIFDKARELDENSPTHPRSSGRHNLDERSQFVGTFRTPISIPDSFRQSMYLHLLRMTHVLSRFYFPSDAVGTFRQRVHHGDNTNPGIVTDAISSSISDARGIKDWCLCRLANFIVTNKHENHFGD